MGAICIINGSSNAVSETFIQAHLEHLPGPPVVLQNYYPEYVFNGRQIRYFHSRHPWLRRWQKLLPQFLYQRLITRHQNSPQAVQDFLAGFVRDHNIDVILAEYGFNGADICADAQALRLPLVVHFHGHDAHREAELAPYRERYQRMFDYASRLISVSRFMTKKLVAMGANPEKIIYNPYGPREYFYEVAPDYADTILAVGRFADIKAPYLTLLAFKMLLEEMPHARLVMVGDGPLREACLNLATVWGIGASVAFPGALRHEESLPLFARACCFVQHSITTSGGDAEGTPVAILEAGAAGLPVVSTRHAGIVDEVIHGHTGFLVEERDVSGMKNHLRQLLLDKALCRSLGTNARIHIRKNFSLAAHLSRLQEAITVARKSAGKH